jgi:hypothetical protein
MPQDTVAVSRIADTHHLDHAELLLLDNAVAHIVEHYVESGTLTATQRNLLEDYRADVVALMTNLGGPALEYTGQLADLVETVLSTQSERRTAQPSTSTGAHRAA